MSTPAQLPAETRPENPMGNWSIKDAIDEMQAACTDAGWYLKQMATNEATRVCWWPGKSGTGKKVNTKERDARPFNGAADHEVHLTQTVINRRNSMRIAAIAHGALTVDPMESSDAKSAGRMRQVLRYYLGGPMRSEVFTQGVRAGSYADRYRACLMYVGWKEERGVEPITITADQLAGWYQQQLMAELAAQADGMSVTEDMLNFKEMILDPEAEATAVELILTMLPGLKERKAEGERQARQALPALRKREDATVHGSYVKRSSPHWEAQRLFIDVFCPAETLMEDGLQSCRWISRVKWRSAQWIKEQAAIHNWNPKWVAKVLKDHKGRCNMFNVKLAATPWAMSGAGTGLGARANSETQNHLYQIVEMWDRSMTPDGLTGTYYTVMHADVNDMVAERKLRADWDGDYPFVPFKFSMDEALLLEGSAVPEVTMTKEQAIKAQWDSRTDAAAFTTFPTWTGDPELEGMRPAPGVFLPSVRGKLPEALQIPPPDGRSIEIENTLRDSVDEFFGFFSKRVPDGVAMAMGQADMDWFMAAFSQVIARTARLIQQYMPPLKGARITGTNELVTSTAAEVRGGFDFRSSFNVKSLNMEWMKEHLAFAKDVLPLDQRGDVNTLPILESVLNMYDPVLASQCLPATRETAQRQTMDQARAALSDIFTGGAPEVTSGMDFGGLAQAVSEEIMRSPLRQQAVIGGSQVHIVLTSYLSGLVNNQKQHGGENAQIGRTLSEDPLAQPSAAEQLMQTLEQLPDGASLWQMLNQQPSEAPAL